MPCIEHWTLLWHSAPRLNAEAAEGRMLEKYGRITDIAPEPSRFRCQIPLPPRLFFLTEGLVFCDDQRFGWQIRMDKLEDEDVRNGRTGELTTQSLSLASRTFGSERRRTWPRKSPSTSPSCVRKKRMTIRKKAMSKKASTWVKGMDQGQGQNEDGGLMIGVSMVTVSILSSNS